jgi:pimeloyl-ACP methyl ester carboxylesterase
VWKAPFVPAGIRLVIIERPGFGESDPLPGRRYLDWPDDLAQVVDQLGIGDFALAGTSGAGPYLHVCGVKLAYRVRKLGVIACMGPADIADGMPLWRRAALALARVAPQKLVKATLPRDPEALYRMLTRDAPPCDRTILESIWASQVAMTAEALRQGPDAFVYELILWHGTEDQAAPLPVAREVARRLPRCTTHFVSGAGHFLHYGRWQEVVDSLIV